MAMFDRLRNAWNAFAKPSQPTDWNAELQPVSYSPMPPQRTQRQIYTERSIVSSIYTTLALDVSGLPIRHTKIDAQGRYLSDVDSPLNNCLTLEANLDQSPRAFRQDIAMTLFDHGVAAIIPVDTSRSPDTDQIFDIYSLRVGEIINWYPKFVKVRAYNEQKGVREDIILEKRIVAIVENPLYSVMNEPNSTLQRLIKKLSLLDIVDDQMSSGKLDLIIQLPYVIKSEARRQQAEARREDVEFQLKGSKYGIAYIDGTEKITQLNRPVENTLLTQVEYLTKLLYVQLGLTPEVMDGTADEAAMINYYTRTIEPIADAVVEALQRAFLGSQGTLNGQRIMYFRDPFKLVPVAQIAEIADKFTRNEILTSNEVRTGMGIAPSSDPKADQLVNSNMPQPTVPVIDKAQEPAASGA